MVRNHLGRLFGRIKVDSWVGSSPQSPRLDEIGGAERNVIQLGHGSG